MPDAKTKLAKSPLSGLNGQFMVMAAHRYCLGRQTYIVGACVEWLRANWDAFEPNTKRVMLRDTIESLQDGTAGGACDVTNWTDFAEWAFEKLGPEDKDWVKGAVAHRHQPWPLKVGVPVCSGCGKPYQWHPSGYGHPSKCWHCAPTRKLSKRGF